MLKTNILIVFFICTLPCAGQDLENVFGGDEDSVYEENEYQQEIAPDTVLIKNLNEVSSDSISAIKKRKEFAYVPLMDSLLKKEDKSALQRGSKPISGFEKFLSSSFFTFFIWLIPIALLLVVLYNLIQSRGTFRKKKRSNVSEDGEQESENINHDYLRLAREASAAGNFRPAVKYLFLRTLQQLSVAGLVHYAADKTNYNYVQEIGSDKKKEFARLVLNYEYVWYGNAIPDKPTYSQIENEFNSFLQKYNLT